MSTTVGENPIVEFEHHRSGSRQFGTHSNWGEVENTRVTLWATNVEDKFIGLSLTEKGGLSMVRVVTEIHSVEEMKALRAFLDATIERIEAAL